MTTNEKIAALRAAAKAAGADGVLIMTSDPHCSEYLPGYYNALPWFSGFIGENSTLVVTQTGSALWCDGRFYVQADKQLAGSEIECMHAGSAGVPTVAEYLESHFADGQTRQLRARHDCQGVHRRIGQEGCLPQESGRGQPDLGRHRRAPGPARHPL